MRTFKVMLRTQKSDFYYFNVISAPTKRIAIARAKLQARMKGYRKTKTYLVHEVI